MTPSEHHIAIAKKDDLEDLLDFIAWEEVLKPELEKVKKDLSSRLVASVLGAPQPGGLTKEQIAGQIFGIDHIQGLIAKIIRQGNVSRAFLRENFNFNPGDLPPVG